MERGLALWVRVCVSKERPGEVKVQWRPLDIRDAGTAGPPPCGVSLSLSGQALCALDAELER